MEKAAKLKSEKIGGKVNAQLEDRLGMLDKKNVAEKKKEAETKKLKQLSRLLERIHQIHRSIQSSLVLAGSAHLTAESMSAYWRKQQGLCMTADMREKLNIDFITDSKLNLAHPSWCAEYVAFSEMAGSETKNTDLVREILVDQADVILNKLPQVHELMYVAIRNKGLRGTAILSSPLLRGKIGVVKEDTKKLKKLVKEHSKLLSKGKYTDGQFALAELEQSLHEQIETAHSLSRTPSGLKQ